VASTGAAQGEVSPKPEQPVPPPGGQAQAQPKGEYRAALGAFLFAPGGSDFALSYRPADSHWLLGLRYVGWVDTFNDPFSGNDLTETTNTMAGAFVEYLFDSRSGMGWYVGIEVLRWAKSEHSLVTGETGSDELVAPFVGGGYLWAFGEHFYADLGMFIAPGVSMTTSTSVSSEEDSGAFDPRLQVGIRF